jgi:hypothetical protein
MLRKDLEAEIAQGYFLLEDSDHGHLQVPIEVIEDDRGDSGLELTNSFPEVQFLVNNRVVAVVEGWAQRDGIVDFLNSEAKKGDLGPVPPAAFVAMVDKPTAFVDVPATQQAMAILIGPSDVQTDATIYAQALLKNVDKFLAASAPNLLRIDLFHKIDDVGAPTWMQVPTLAGNAKASVQLNTPDTFALKSVQKIVDRTNQTRLSHRLWILAFDDWSDGVQNLSDGREFSDLFNQEFRDHPRADSADVMISSTCHGALFREAMSCGFFETRPVSSQTPCGGDNGSEYLSSFLSVEVTPAEADLDHDGSVSFAEAHWYASNRLAVGGKSVPYTSIDALAERTLADWRSKGDPRYVSSLSDRDLVDLAVFADAGEKSALKHLGFVPKKRLTPQELWQQDTTDSYLMKLMKYYFLEATSKGTVYTVAPSEGVEDSGDSQTVQWIQIARRLLINKYAQKTPTEPFAVELARLRSCENQPIREFLGVQ